MAGGMDVIKSYLVSLGFHTDRGSFNQANQAIGAVEQSVKKLAGSFAIVGKAAFAVGAAMTTAAVGVGKFLDGLGNQEINMEILSREMWTTTQQAQQFSLTLKALGANLQQLYMSPTLMAQYRQLSAIAAQMQTPADYVNQMRTIQNITLQFKAMRLEASYATQWIGYYLIKDLAGPLGNVQSKLQKFNSLIVKDMPVWTKHIAAVIASFIDFAGRVGNALGSAYKWMQMLLSYVPGWAKGIAVAIAGLGIAFGMNPFGQFVIGISALLLLLDDFYVYIKGGKSQFAPFWSWLMKLAGGTGSLHSQLQNIQGNLKQFGQTLQSIGNSAQSMYQDFQDNGTFSRLENGASAYAGALKSLATAIGNVVSAIGDLSGAVNHSQGGVEGFFQMLANVLTGSFKFAAGFIQEIATSAQMFADLSHGNFGAVAKDFKQMWTGQNLADIGLLSQQRINDWYGSYGPKYGPPSNAAMWGNTSNANVTINQTNNIQTNDPTSAMSAVNGNLNPVLMRNIRSVVQ